LNHYCFIIQSDKYYLYNTESNGYVAPFHVITQSDEYVAPWFIKQRNEFVAPLLVRHKPQTHLPHL
jgi:hypothetical protein